VLMDKHDFPIMHSFTALEFFNKLDECLYVDGFTFAAGGSRTDRCWFEVGHCIPQKCDGGAVLQTPDPWRTEISDKLFHMPSSINFN
jgi:hypothetical protein